MCALHLNAPSIALDPAARQREDLYTFTPHIDDGRAIVGLKMEIVLAVSGESRYGMANKISRCILKKSTFTIFQRLKQALVDNSNKLISQNTITDIANKVVNSELQEYSLIIATVARISVNVITVPCDASGVTQEEISRNTRSLISDNRSIADLEYQQIEAASDAFSELFRGSLFVILKI